MNYKELLLGVMLVFLAPFSASGQDDEQIREEISLSGKQLALIKVALSELRKQGLDSLGYRVGLYRTGKTYVVIFEDPNVAPGQRGASPSMPTYEIEVDEKFRMVRTNFSR